MSRQWLIAILVLFGIFVFASQGLKGGPEISPREAAALLKGTPPPAVIDVRDRAAFDQGRIAGARSVPMAEFKTRLESLKLPKTEVIILYDEEGTLARDATRLLYENGYQGALTLTGGLAAWRAAGQSLEQSAPSKP